MMLSFYSLRGQKMILTVEEVRWVSWLRSWPRLVLTTLNQKGTSSSTHKIINMQNIKLMSSFTIKLHLFLFPKLNIFNYVCQISSSSLFTFIQTSAQLNTFLDNNIDASELHKVFSLYLAIQFLPVQCILAEYIDDCPYMQYSSRIQKV